jgi:hypothetical protein
MVPVKKATAPTQNTKAKITTSAKVATKTVAAAKIPAEKGPAKKTTAGAASKKAARGAAGADDEDRARTEAAAVVRALVATSDTPVALAKVADAVREEIGVDLARDWVGTGGLKKLLKVLDLQELAVSAGGPGHVYDPARHRSPTN